jgi:predicted RNA polymerase sigma factor
VSGEVAAAARAEIVARTGYGRLLAVLATGTHDIAGAEDALADAFERALRHWPVDGVPVRPEAWLLTVARNRLRDRWRSAEVSRTGPLDVERQAPVHLDDLDAVGTDALPERRLELMLVCAHPAVSRAAHTPLMLNTVLGFTAADIARAYAVPAATMTTRLTRAKRRIRDNRIPFEVPGADALRPRMDAVLAAVYAAYVIEWSTGPEERNLPPEGPYLAEVLAQLLPEDPEARGLAALVALSTARRPARTGPDGELVTLGDQDPSLWDAALIQRGHDHLRAAHAGGVLGRYQLEAAIQAVHCDRARTGTTDWAALLDLHRALEAVAPTLASATALAAVTAEVDGPEAGLRRLDGVLARSTRFQPAWATRADLLTRAGRTEPAEAAYERAIALTHDPGARGHLERRLAALRDR